MHSNSEHVLGMVAFDNYLYKTRNYEYHADKHLAFLFPIMRSLIECYMVACSVLFQISDFFRLLKFTITWPPSFNGTQSKLSRMDRIWRTMEHIRFRPFKILEAYGGCNVSTFQSIRQSIPWGHATLLFYMERRTTIAR